MKRRVINHDPNDSINDEPDIEDLCPPSDWQKIYSAIKHQRAIGPKAAVDTMGCDSHSHSDPKVARYHALISLMISAQCKDTQNALTMAILKQHCNGLTIEYIDTMDESELRELIRPCGLHNRKASYIKRTTRVLLDEYGGDIPKTIGEIVGLPGVGPKMGYLLLHSAWGLLDGIGVDTHVHRISNLLGWVRTNAPEKTRVELEKFIPREEWKVINHLMVGLGQTVCLPRGRKCDECAVKEAGCPAVVAPSPRKKKAKMEGVTEDKIKEEVEQLEIESPYFAALVKEEVKELEG